MIILIAISVSLLGLVFGSFVNAFVWRLHEQEVLKETELLLQGKKGTAKKIAKINKQLEDLSISKGRSMCPNCEHTLAAKDLVPVLSWVFLRGRCRYCKVSISRQYPFVELLGLLLFLVSYIYWPIGFHGIGLIEFLFFLFFIIMFLALAIYDIHWFQLPDRVVYPVVVIAILEVLITAVNERRWSALWEPIVGAIIIFGLFYLLFQISKGQWIGGGDVKIAIALGLIVGTPLHAFLVIFIASLVGTLASIPLIAHGKKGLKAQIPFGPYLLLATYLVVLFGEQFVHWYSKILVT